MSGARIAAKESVYITAYVVRIVLLSIEELNG